MEIRPGEHIINIDARKTILIIFVMYDFIEVILSMYVTKDYSCITLHNDSTPSNSEMRK